MGCGSEDRLTRHLRVGEHRPDQLEEREACPGRGQDCRHGLGPGGDLGCQQGPVPGPLGF